MSSFEFYGLSHPGRRENNEDAYLALSLDSETSFLAVCDGMGGVEGGELASNIVIDITRSFFEQEYSQLEQTEDLKSILRVLYNTTQEKLREEKKKMPGREGIGTTFTCLLQRGNRYVVGNVGDSRVYQLRGEKITQVTEDHTHVQEFQKKTGNEFDPNLLSLYGHLITRAIDGGQDKPDLYPLDQESAEIEDGDGFILCSDGLIMNKSNSSQEFIRDYLIGESDLKSTAEQLIAYAYHSGSTDNITVIAASYGTLHRDEIVRERYSYPPAEEAPKTIIIDTVENNQVPQINTFITKKSIVIIGVFCCLFVIIGILFFTTITKKRNIYQRPDTKGLIAKEDSVVPALHRENKVVPWDAFSKLYHELPYRISTEQFQWGQYPYPDSVKYYSITFDHSTPIKVKTYYCPLRDALGPKSLNECIVSVSAVLIDGRVISSATTIVITLKE